VLERNLEQLGFSSPADVARRVRSWSDGSYRALRSAAAIEAFEAILPALLEALSAAPDPDRALIRWETLLGKLSSAINLFRLLEARPGLFDQLVRILTLADPLADELARRPDLLDILIDASALDLPASVEQLAAAMRIANADYERQLDRIRIVTGEKRFAMGVQLIEAAHDPLDIGAGLSRLAEASLAVAQDATEREFAAIHGRIEGGELAIIGLGRLGGGILTHASDLDMVYLFSGTHEAESDGARPLGATLYFNRLAQRVSGALSVPTAHGALYEVDTRLRPQGAQGPLAVSMDSFARYQAEEAWTWEHMALTRARVLTGSPRLREELDRLIAGVLHTARDPEKLREDVLSMRGDMATHKPAKGPLDAKLQRGGLVDLEFLIHFVQLRERTGFAPDLAAALDLLVQEGLVPAGLCDAHAVLTRLLIGTRLLAPGLDVPPPAAAAAEALAKTCGEQDLKGLQSVFNEARRIVAAAWHEILGTTLEISS
jgi:glutamate-ammonia-ligase adenylyltransferase